jgi:hypothetical protein
MKSLISILFLGFLGLVVAQEPHDKPDHPKGNNSNDQYLALPFYNEACELYSKGQIQRAKTALYEAINTSMALTEAQLFLAKIFFEEGIIDSAFVYYNSGIDFAIEQDPHHYFPMIETGLMVGQYDMVKHNMKQFKKLYSKTSEGKYEDDYPYTVDDWERWMGSIEVIYDVNYWIPKAHLLDTLNIQSTKQIASVSNDILVYEGNSSFLLRKKKGSFKKKKNYKFGFKGIEDVRISESGQYMFYSKGDEKSRDIFFRKKNGKKWGEEIKLPEEVNKAGWDADPFFFEEYSILYFSTDRNGSKDLFLAKLDLENNTCKHLEELKYMNSKHDEINPVYHNKMFYFSSNGHRTFGGFDLYGTADNRIVNEILVPTTVRNMGKPYNSNKDETEIVFLENDQRIVNRKDFKGQQWYILYKPLSEEEHISWDIKTVTLPVNDGD